MPDEARDPSPPPLITMMSPGRASSRAGISLLGRLGLTRLIVRFGRKALLIFSIAAAAVA